jgi:hypothetical protein
MTMSVQKLGELPELRKLELNLGGLVDLNDVVGRDRLVENLLLDLKHTSFMINETRRFGKTTFLRFLESKLSDEWICINTTVQDARSTSGLIELTFQCLLQHSGAKKRFQSILLAVGKMAAGAKLDFGGLEFKLENSYESNALATFKSVLKSIGTQLIEKNQYLLIIWDEFPDAIRAITEKEGSNAAEDILKFFRALRGREEYKRIRWILTGSVGFHHVLRRLPGRSDSINDMVTIGLEPLALEYIQWTANGLLLGIGQKIDTNGVLAKMSGGIPFILEMMIKYIRDYNIEIPTTHSEAQKLLINSASNANLGSNWTPLLERVHPYYGEELAGLAESTLDAVAKTPMETELMKIQLSHSMPAVPDEKIMNRVLSLLVQDHYLQYDVFTGIYSWKYEPLRLIWQAKRQKGL